MVKYAKKNVLFSQYMFNTLAFNPAYAGSRNVVTANVLYRNQRVGIEGGSGDWNMLNLLMYLLPMRACVWGFS